MPMSSEPGQYSLLCKGFQAFSVCSGIIVRSDCYELNTNSTSPPLSSSVLHALFRILVNIFEYSTSLDIQGRKPTDYDTADRDLCE